MRGQKFYCETCGRQVTAEMEHCPGCRKEFYGVMCPMCGLNGPAKTFAAGCPGCGFQSGKRPGSKSVSPAGARKHTGMGAKRRRSIFSAPRLPDWAVYFMLPLLAGLTGLLAWLLYVRLA